MVRYALERWDKKDDLDHGAFGNCTNFVSSSLEAGRMKKRFSPWTGLMCDDTWGRRSGTGWDRLDQNAYHSESWARAEGCRTSCCATAARRSRGRTRARVTSSSTSRWRPARKRSRARPTMPPSSPRSPLTGTSS
ncbi:amidase domain-containing protein [Streptomyces sp. WM6372]|uniref:amidase domain-containing protein n=1 Tax=Streptomyces sp. WM6372 TaxID=1415555 RepID=UPI00099D995A